MTITNGYLSLDELAGDIGIGDSWDDGRLEIAIEAASRQIDSYTGRRFWQDSTAQTREFYADDSRTLESRVGQVLDISTTTGLVVKCDDGDNGGFATTLTINTHFILTPTNAADDSWPYTGIRIVDSSYGFPMSASGRPGVQVTAKFGWASVPAPVKSACKIVATGLYKGTDVAFGVLAFGDSFSSRVPGINPMVKALLDPYKVAVA